MRLFLVAVAAVMVGCSDTVAGADGQGGQQIAQKYLDERSAAMPPVVYPLDKVTLVEGPLHSSDPAQGMVAAASLSAYQTMQEFGWITISSFRKPDPNNFLSMAPGIRGQFVAATTDAGKSLQPCSAKVLSSVKGRSVLCLPQVPSARVEQIVKDEQLAGGGEQYRWLMGVARVVRPDDVFQAKWHDRIQGAWKQGDPQYDGRWKFSLAFKLDPFSNTWKPMPELDSFVTIGKDIQQDKASQFFRFLAMRKGN